MAKIQIKSEKLTVIKFSLAKLHFLSLRLLAVGKKVASRSNKKITSN